MLKILFVLLSILIIFIFYRQYIGPSKLERDIIKKGGLHPCFYCKKTINIDSENCEYCNKPNYKSLRKGRLKIFIVTILMFLFAVAKLYRNIFPH